LTSYVTQICSYRVLLIFARLLIGVPSCWPCITANWNPNAVFSAWYLYRKVVIDATINLASRKAGGAEVWLAIAWRLVNITFIDMSTANISEAFLDAPYEDFAKSYVIKSIKHRSLLM
jgi:hypothetical protein